MSARQRSAAELAALTAILATLPDGAAAYIDPGSGALVVQAILSASLGALFLARKALRSTAARLMQVLRSRKPDPPTGADEPR